MFNPMKGQIVDEYSNWKDLQDHKLAMSQSRQSRAMDAGAALGEIAGRAAQSPAQVAFQEALSAGERMRKTADELRSRLEKVLAPQVPQPAGEVGVQRAIAGSSPVVESLTQLARMSEGTTEVLTDILRRLEI